MGDTTKHYGLIIFCSFLTFVGISVRMNVTSKASAEKFTYKIHKIKSHQVVITKNTTASRQINFTDNHSVHKDEVFKSNKQVVLKFKDGPQLTLDYIKDGSFKGYVNSGFAKSYGIDPTPDLEAAFEENCITTPKEVAQTPWETYDDGSDVLEPLSNGRDIYYHLNSTGQFADIWKQAIYAWNDLGVVQFVPTDSIDSQHVLILDNTNHIAGQDNTWDGITMVNNNSSSDSSLAYNYAYLNTEYVGSDKLSNLQKKSVAEHELGHFLGFDHDTRTYGDYKFYGNNAIEPVMYPGTANDSYDHDYLQLTVGALEQHALAKHYNLSILPNNTVYPLLDLATTSNNGNNSILDYSVANRNTDYDYLTNTFNN